MREFNCHHLEYPGYLNYLKRHGKIVSTKVSQTRCSDSDDSLFVEDYIKYGMKLKAVEGKMLVIIVHREVITANSGRGKLFL